MGRGGESGRKREIITLSGRKGGEGGWGLLDVATPMGGQPHKADRYTETHTRREREKETETETDSEKQASTGSV